MAIIDTTYKAVNELPIVRTTIKGKSPFAYLEVETCFDTGASMTSINKLTAKLIGAEPYPSRYSIQTVNGITRAQCANIEIYLTKESEPIRKEVLVVENQSIEMLVGMDIIAMGDFSLIHQDGQRRFVFHVPNL